MNAPLDLLVLGSGVAGLSAAVRAARVPGLRVGVATKGELDQATTRWAQGGIAAVLRGDPDSTDLHLADTLAAGAGLCDVDAVRVLVDEGPARVLELVTLGARFDLDAGGAYALSREGGHSEARVLHAGGAATGVEVERALVEAVRAEAVEIREGWFALDLLVESGRCVGVVGVDETGRVEEIRARDVLLATGGAGQLFSVTTNPSEATGDGLAMALRAGVAVADLEFVQFHPTALHHPRTPRPLLSEALRGHGALLRDPAGERFVDELAPRDIVSRAMTRRMLDLGVDHLFLDATPLDHFAERFPTLAAQLGAVGLDPARDLVPIAPAAHYLCGGVVTDLDGATSLPGLWAAGECTCTGVHGANRLASNSLLDGMVFAARVVEAIAVGRSGPVASGAMRAVLGGADGEVIGGRAVAWSPTPLGAEVVPELGAVRDRLQRTLTTTAGVLRSHTSLDEAAAVIATLAPAVPAPAPGGSRDALELANLVTIADALVAVADVRAETRGAHTRTDHPDPDDRFRCRLVVGPQGVPTGSGGTGRT